MPGTLGITDDWSGYACLRKRGYDPYAIAECGGPEVAEEFPPIIHLVFSNLKTWLNGIHHGVSAKHLQAYLHEFTFRFNRRFYPFKAFRSLLGIAGGVVTPSFIPAIGRTIQVVGVRFNQIGTASLSKGKTYQVVTIASEARLSGRKVAYCNPPPERGPVAEPSARADSREMHPERPAMFPRMFKRLCFPATLHLTPRIHYLIYIDLKCWEWLWRLKLIRVPTDKKPF